MTGAERGLLLLSCRLGCPERRPLTVTQLRTLSLLAAQRGNRNAEGEVGPRELTELGCSAGEADRICALLRDEALLDRYLRRAQALGIRAVTRISPAYPARVLAHLRRSSPPALFLLGDVGLLQTRCISLTGSREPDADGERFAREVGRQAALQGYTLVSGDARGADRAGQAACLEAGGCVIAVVPDRLDRRQPTPGVLYCSEEGFDLPFSSERALRRNRLIHLMGEKTLVAQVLRTGGGTWEGAVDNLRHGWTPVFQREDGGAAAQALARLGAAQVSLTQLKDYAALLPQQISLFQD